MDILDGLLGAEGASAAKHRATESSRSAKASPPAVAPLVASGAPPPPPRRGGNSANQSSAPSEETPTDAEALAAMAKLVCVVARQQAVIQSALITVVVFIAEKAPSILPAVKAKTQEYAAAGKKLSSIERGQRPPPHVFAWNSLVAALVAEESQKGSSTKIQEAVKTHHTQVTALAKEQCQALKLSEKDHLQMQVAHQIQLQIKFCKVTECFKSANHKIEVLAVPGSTAEKIVQEAIAFLAVEAGGSQKPSVAPKGRLERVVSDWVAAAEQPMRD